MVNLKNMLYLHRKRIDDDTLIKIKTIVDDEISRREQAESKNVRGG